MIGQLSNTNFTYSGTTYTVERSSIDNSDSTLRFKLNKAVPAALKSALVLHVGTSQFPLANATLSGSDTQLNWNNSGLSWSVGDMIQLSLVEPGTSTVSGEYSVTLMADNLRPAEGETVTLTATLDNPAPAGGATGRFIKARGSAAAGYDFTWSPAHPDGTTRTAEISIGEGDTAFTATLMVTNDGRAEGDETIEVSFGLDPASLIQLNDPRLTLTIPANTGRTDDTPIDDTPPPPISTPPTVNVPPTDGGPPPGEPSDSDPDSPPCGTDREDLESFYEASGGVNWHEKENWNSAKPLNQWHGVDTDDGEVVSLRLPGNNLSGDMPTTELLCLEELKELALWGNELSGDIPDKLELAVERAVLRDIEEMLNINPEWFENYEEPYDFEYWHTGVTTDDGRVTELDFTGEEITGEIPESVFELQRLEEIRTGCGVTLEGEAPEGVSVMAPDDCEAETSGDGGCALGSGNSSVFGLFLVTLLVFAVLGRKRMRRD